MNASRTVPLLVAALTAAALAGCSSGAAPAPPPVTVTVPVPAPAPAAPTAATAPAATEWPMPNVVGMNLQAAQDHLQAVTGFGVPLSTSTDASGQGRAQILDPNWVVCAQTPAAGTTITTGVVPDFTVVKTDERC